MTGEWNRIVLRDVTRPSQSPDVSKKTSLFVRSVSAAYRNRRRVATLGAAALALGLGYHVVFGQNGLTAYQQKRVNSVNLDKELAALTQENNLLKGHVERLQNDPSAIEHQAREALHYTRADEVVYTLPADSQAPGR